MVLLNALITVVEIVGGLLSNSLSLLSDAVHNLGDTLALAFAYAAQRIGRRRPDARYTFGYKRVEVLAAFVNAFVLMLICLFLLREAYQRWRNPDAIDGGLMLLVAVVGLVANLISVALLHRDNAGSMNVRAAYLHLLGDTLSSLAVIAGGIAIWLYGIVWLDPLITALVSLYIMYHTVGVLREAVGILMQTTPEGVDVEELKRDVESMRGVDNLHHLHVWQLYDGQIHLEAHVKTSEDLPLSHLHPLHESIETLLSDKYGIRHATLQMEYGRCMGGECPVADC